MVLNITDENNEYKKYAESTLSFFVNNRFQFRNGKAILKPLLSLTCSLLIKDISNVLNSFISKHITCIMYIYGIVYVSMYVYVRVYMEVYVCMYRYVLSMCAYN